MDEMQPFCCRDSFFKMWCSCLGKMLVFVDEIWFLLMSCSLLWMRLDFCGWCASFLDKICCVAHCKWCVAFCGWDVAVCGWDVALCGWYVGSILLSADTVESKQKPMKKNFCMKWQKKRPKKRFVADGQKIPQVICTEISRLNIQKSGRSFYVIFSPVYIELSLR